MRQSISRHDLGPDFAGGFCAGGGRADIAAARAKFQGQIRRNAKESTPDFPKEVKAPPGAPNVLLIMTDDVGFGASSTFGGPIPTPTLDRLARSGLRYNQFHTTALCSPTRAALLTGRNHHTCATGVIMEIGTGYPGYNSLMPKSCGTVARDPQAERLQHRPGSARTTTCPTGRPARPGRSTAGRPGKASSISTASSAATRASGIRPFSRAPSRSEAPRRQELSLRPRHGRPCHRLDSPAARRWRRTSRSSPTTRRARRTRRTMRRRSGSRSSRASSTRAGTRSARKPSRGRRSWASCPPIPS